MDHPSFSSSKWFYCNFIGEEKGPYSGEEMFDWYKDGYFTCDLMVRRSTQQTFFRLGSPRCFTQSVQIVDLEPEDAGSSRQIKIEDTQRKEETKTEDTQRKEDYVVSLLKKKNKISQEYPVEQVHKKAKIENEKTYCSSLRDKRSDKDTKVQLKEDNIDKGIKTKNYSLRKALQLRKEINPNGDFSKEIEEFNKRRRNNSHWEFEKVASKCGRGPPEYYVKCTACPLALKDHRIRQMVQISEFLHHVRKAHGDDGLKKMYSGFFPGCKICGASNVNVKNIENHKKCIDQL